MEFQDTIAECSQGYFGAQYGPNEIAGYPIPYEDGLSALIALNADVLSFYEAIADDKSLSGIINAVNDFQQELLQHIYLFRLASKDGSSDVATTNTESPTSSF